MKPPGYFCILFLILFFDLSAFARSEENNYSIDYKPVNVYLEIKNAHIWRSAEITGSAMIDANMKFADPSNTFGGGIWAATSFEGTYKEFDYYLFFRKGGFLLEAWDVFNFSPTNAYDPIKNPRGYNVTQAFNYRSRETGRFIELRLFYLFPDKFPLNVGWSTVIFGRDRGYDNEKNLYSTYVEADYPLWRGGFAVLKLGIAFAFALSPEKINGKTIENSFYGKYSGFSNVNITLSKTIEIGSFNFPVSVKGVWNPNDEKTYMQLAINFLSF